MKLLARIASTVLAIAVLVSGVWVVWQVAGRIGAFLSTLDKDAVTTIVATSGTILVSVVTVVLTNRSIRLREIAESHRPEKIKVYNVFMTTMVDQLKAAKKPGPVPRLADSASFVDAWFEFKRGMIVWASPETIRAYLDFENDLTASPDDGTALKTISNLDAVLRAVRKDLGNSNRKLDSGSLVGMFLTKDARQSVKATDA